MQQQVSMRSSKYKNFLKALMKIFVHVNNYENIKELILEHSLVVMTKYIWPKQAWGGLIAYNKSQSS